MPRGASDVEPLQHLVNAHGRGELETWPLLIVRHAKAKPRSSWTKAEGDRPLAATGTRQAQSVGRLLQSWKPGHVVSSPWLRCVATIAPYAKAAGAKVKLHESLTEHRHSRNPKKTAAVAEALFDKQRPVALCTHRPALPTIFAQLGKHMTSQLRDLLPSSDPFLAPGEIIVCHVAHSSKKKVVAVERFRPFDD